MKTLLQINQRNDSKDGSIDAIIKHCNKHT